jgi:hypothetical protein
MILECLYFSNGDKNTRLELKTYRLYFFLSGALKEPRGEGAFFQHKFFVGFVGEKGVPGVSVGFGC